MKLRVVIPTGRLLEGNQLHRTLADGTRRVTSIPVTRCTRSWWSCVDVTSVEASLLNVFNNLRPRSALRRPPTSCAPLRTRRCARSTNPTGRRYGSDRGRTPEAVNDRSALRLRFSFLSVVPVALWRGGSFGCEHPTPSPHAPPSPSQRTAGRYWGGSAHWPDPTAQSARRSKKSCAWHVPGAPPARPPPTSHSPCRGQQFLAHC